jgi:hypothetical protein
MKPSAFIIAELAVLLARLESADNALSHMPVITPHKHVRSIVNIRHEIAILRAEMIAEQSEHERRIDVLFGVSIHDDTIPF